jgi:hypothetical protein
MTGSGLPGLQAFGPYALVMLKDLKDRDSMSLGGACQSWRELA